MTEQPDQLAELARVRQAIADGAASIEPHINPYYTCPNCTCPDCTIATALRDANYGHFMGGIYVAPGAQITGGFMPRQGTTE